MGAVRALTVTDMRNVRRDSLLRFLLIYPWLLGILMRFLIPWATEQLAGTFDLLPYYPLIVGFFGILITPQLAGFVTGLPGCILSCSFFGRSEPSPLPQTYFVTRCSFIVGGRAAWRQSDGLAK